MVAAGGGGAEWSATHGGDGDELEGGSAIQAKNATGKETFENECKGANQTSGSNCEILYHGYISQVAYPGSFGSAGSPQPQTKDYGGYGGGGYYGGTSYGHAWGGSGGSSFISGYKGCKAVRKPMTEDEQIQHEDHPIHYSNISFIHTKMIGGNKEMPLPDGTKGIWDSSLGSFRITLISVPNPFTVSTNKIIFVPMLFIFVLFNK